MTIHQHIKDTLQSIRSTNEANTTKYKERIKAQIVENLRKGESAQAQKPLADKYYNAAPRSLTQIQQAFEGAVL
jgi:hypothetical protein